LRFAVRWFIVLVFAAWVANSTTVSADNETWTGGDNNDSEWMSNGNWSGIGGAAAGDDLIFPSGAARKSTSHNNFPVNTNFNSVQFTGGADGYNITGNGIQLGALGFFSNVASGAGPVFGPNILFPANTNRTFTNTSLQPITFGGVVNFQGGNLSLAGAGNHIFNGAITSTGAPGSIFQNGTGLTTINSNATGMNDAINIVAGEVRVNGTAGVIQLSGGTLSGNGVVGRIDGLNGGTIAPGDGGPGILNGTNGAALDGSTTLSIQLNGLTLGTQYDTLSLSGGNAALGNATLSLALALTPSLGTQFTIIQCGPGCDVTGQFAQGSSISAGGRTFSITYNQDSVVLTAIATTVTWDGGGINASWTTNNNWVSNLAPIAGDNLVFPAGAAQLTNTNTFVPGRTFGSIQVNGSGYVIGGNAINLSGGLAGGAAAGATFNVPITLTQDLAFGTNAGQFSIGSTVNLNGHALSLTPAPGTTQILTGAISGAGSLAKTLAGEARLLGNNSYTGTTQVNQGILVTSSSGLGGATPGNGTTVASGASLRLSSSSPTLEPLTLSGAGAGGIGALSAFPFCTPCTAGGPITLAANATIGATSGESLTLSGSISQSPGVAGITKTGSGFLTLAGNSSYTGATNINQGLVNVTGSIASSASIGAGTLVGTGTVGAIVDSGLNGTISPGTSAGILNSGTVFGLVAGTKLSIELGGLTPGTQYDRLNVTGTVSLGGATLLGSFINGFTPSVGNQFTIIQSTLPITGQFAQGTAITIGGEPFSIAYSTNSVVLTALASTLTWSGLGGDNNWATPQNWVGNIAPSAGDSLVFPAGAPRLTNTNNFPAATNFNAITLSGSAYIIGGAAVTLSNGVSGGAGGLAPNLSVPITFTQDQAFNVNTGQVTISGAVNLNGRQLTMSVAANSSLLMDTSAIISGSGSVTKTGTGQVVFLAPSSYTGLTQVEQGTVRIDSITALGASGPANGTNVAAGATLELSASITTAETLVLNGTGVNGNGALVASCSFSDCGVSGPITLAGSTSVDVRSSSTLTLTGVINESGGSRTLTISNGHLRLDNANSYTGATIVTNATLRVDGVIGAVLLNNGSVLSGTGTTGVVTASPGVVAPGAVAGVLHTGSVFFNPQSTLNIELGGLTVGAQYDQLSATGSVNLGGAGLLISLINAFVPLEGSPFTIITATGGVTGQFVQGTSITAGAHQYSITYNASSVVLTKVTPTPDLAITKTHSGDFTQGDLARTYTTTVSNVGNAPTAGTVTVTDAAPAGLTITAMGGTGWTCTTLPSCTRADALAPAASYPVLTVQVNVSISSPSPVNNVATVSGGGDINAGNNSGNDLTTILLAPPDLTITKSHVGDFAQGDLGRTYTVTVTNIGIGPKPNLDVVTVTDTPPPGLIVTAISGAGWDCSTLPICSRDDLLADGDSYPPLTVTVSVTVDATSPAVNHVDVTTGAGESNLGNNTANDSTAIAVVVQSTCPNQGPDIVATIAGAFNAVWCGGPVDRADLTTFLSGGAGPVSAIFFWNNGAQQFKFWFRGFPDNFQTLDATGALSTGSAYFFQTTGPATIPQGTLPLFGFPLAGVANIVATGPGAYSAVWSGNDHPDTAQIGASFLNTGPGVLVSAIFQWNNASQQFNFWFRGFPANFQTLPSGVERGRFYFFQTTGAATIPMD
jgi:uncharacterized repeat protein (TIGR01451 family)